MATRGGTKPPVLGGSGLGRASDTTWTTITLPDGTTAQIPVHAKTPVTGQLINREVRPSEMAEEIGRISQEDVEESVSDEVFSLYKHNELLPGCRPHPGDIVEAGSLAAVSLPKPTYRLQDSIPREILESEKLSSLQCEGIMYASQRHQIILPNGERAGFFIGDGAGVGKGRQIAGIILDNLARKRSKHIWFSISADLVVDAKRDMSDIGCHVNMIEGCKQLDKETKIFGLLSDFKRGVVFSTYATLVSSTMQKGSGFPSQGSRNSRLQQLVDWCGGSEFDGCIVFDECHKAKNFIPDKEKASTKVAVAVTGIQRILPKARVVYCSATGVTDVKNMAFMERLGLWGDGAPFSSFQTFLESIHKKGLGLAEMLAMEMKASGIYVSRGLSFKQAEFITLEANLTKEQIKTYDKAAHLWNEVKKALEIALQRTGSTNVKVWSSFWGAHQRFFRQLCMCLKVPTIIEEVKSALTDGNCVVIGLQTTGEASLEYELKLNKNTITDFLSICREIISRFVEHHFPTVIENSTTDVHAAGPRTDPWCVQAKEMLSNFAKQIDLPVSTLDEIIDKCGGPSQIAEMTGRKGRVIRSGPDENPRYQLRVTTGCNSLENLNVRERNAFMDGHKLIAIISDAASTGISLHADQRAGNQRRRIHLTIELPWGADKAVQQMGRSHRTNQTSGPLYKLLTTDLGGERRFAASVARRLQSLGAITKGDRRAASGADLGEFNFDTPYGRSALRSMYNCIIHRELYPGVNVSTVMGNDTEFATFNKQMQESLVLMGIVDSTALLNGGSLQEKEAGDVTRFLNRILGLAVRRQNTIFNYFTECLGLIIQNEKKEGRYNEGLLDIVASSITVSAPPRHVFNGSTRHVVLTVDRGMDWEQAQTRLGNHGGPYDGFYRSKKETRGKHLYLLATHKEHSMQVFKISRPNTGVSAFDEDKEALLSRYVKIPDRDAEKGWKDIYASSKSKCIHGPHCKSRPQCTVGSRCYKLHLLSGGIVGLMSTLETTVAKNSAKFQLSKQECNLRVVRVQLDNAQRLVGLRFPEVLIRLAEKVVQEKNNLKRSKDASNGHLGLLNGPDHIPGNSQVTQVHRVQIIEPETAVSKKHLERALNPPTSLKSFFKPSYNREGSVLENAAKRESPRNCKQPLPTAGPKRIAETMADTPPTKRFKQGSLLLAFGKQAEQKKESGKLLKTCPICKTVFEPHLNMKVVNEHIDDCLIE